MMTKRLMGWLAAGVLAAATVPGVGFAMTARSLPAHKVTTAQALAARTSATSHARKTTVAPKRIVAKRAVKRSTKVQPKIAHRTTVRKTTTASRSLHRTPVRHTTTSRHVVSKSTRHLVHHTTARHAARHATSRGKLTSHKLVARHRAPAKKLIKN